MSTTITQIIKLIFELFDFFQHGGRGLFQDSWCTIDRTTGYNFTDIEEFREADFFDYSGGKQRSTAFAVLLV